MTDLADARRWWGRTTFSFNIKKRNKVKIKIVESAARKLKEIGMSCYISLLSPKDIIS